MKNYKCSVEYDGTLFSGWGKQPSLRTVQGEIEKALYKIFAKQINIVCAGRTDKGVHALGQIISFNASEIKTEKLILRLNSLLPKDISIRSCEFAENSFDARKSAISKIYIYKIFNNPVRSPLLENRVWHIIKPLDIEKMKKTASFLQNKRDYSVFDSYNSVFDFKIIDLKNIKIVEKQDIIEISIEGDHFLYKMIRKIVGEMVRIAADEKSLDIFKDAVINKDKSKIGKPAPPYALYLKKIIY